MTPTTINALMAKYRVFLIDAYGVLVTSAGPLPGAQAFIRELNSSRDHTYFILTNDASRIPESCAAYYHSHGVEVPTERVLTAGLAIAPALKRLGLAAPRCFVLGTPDTHIYVERAGGVAVPHSEDSDYDAVVIGDDSGFDVLKALNALLTSLHRKVKNGSPLPALLLPNSDFLYPKGPDAFGFTSGALARWLELGLQHLHPGLEWKFEVLGKPARALFDLALQKARRPSTEALMIGDQLHTDVQGANAVGLASALVVSDLTSRQLDSKTIPAGLRPTWLLNGL